MNRQNRIQFEKLIGTYQDQLFSMAFYRIGSRADAEDIVQEVFVNLYNDGNLDRAENPKSYLFRCVMNRCTDWTRNKQKHPLVPLQPSLAADSEHQDTELEEEYARINKLISTLPPEQGDVLMMKCVNNLSFVEIADILGVPASTVKSRFKYGIDKLRATVTEKR